MPEPSRRRPPLGLPSGSVRALLTFLIVAVVLVQLARGRDVETLWTETMMIALAHYFTSRLLVLGCTATAYLAGYADLVPRTLRDVTLGLVLF
jgi:hypothetical protein